jgi:hypothetical protein
MSNALAWLILALYITAPGWAVVVLAVRHGW